MPTTRQRTSSMRVRAAQLPEPAKPDTAGDWGPNLVDSLRRTVDAKIQATWQKVRREKRARRTATKKLKCGDVIISGESEGKGAEATPSPAETERGRYGLGPDDEVGSAPDEVGSKVIDLKWLLKSVGRRSERSEVGSAVSFQLDNDDIGKGKIETCRLRSEKKKSIPPTNQKYGGKSEASSSSPSGVPENRTSAAASKSFDRGHPSGMSGIRPSAAAMKSVCFEDGGHDFGPQRYGMVGPQFKFWRSDDGDVSRLDLEFGFELCWCSLVDPVIFLLSLSNEKSLQIFRELSDVLAERLIGSEGCAPKRRGGLLSRQNLGPSRPWDTKVGRWLYGWKGEEFGPALRTCSVLKRSARPRGRARCCRPQPDFEVESVWLCSLVAV
ncbi:protein-protein interaction regulator family protein [Striga asiatica]|uniref:Protein-protein interaction regulator family protein n=1 Tax=Striga asiatica TaxID=4170 RepID=A0A5A7Q3U9_STRAF|nr:protein-protein interaction regulator family protein [Striga asiatica]